MQNVVSIIDYRNMEWLSTSTVINEEYKHFYVMQRVPIYVSYVRLIYLKILVLWCTISYRTRPKFMSIMLFVTQSYYIRKNNPKIPHSVKFVADLCQNKIAQVYMKHYSLKYLLKPTFDLPFEIHNVYKDLPILFLNTVV